MATQESPSDSAPALNATEEQPRQQSPGSPEITPWDRPLTDAEKEFSKKTMQAARQLREEYLIPIYQNLNDIDVCE